mgnify:CR=1 FL=1
MFRVRKSARRRLAFVALIPGIQEWCVWNSRPRNFFDMFYVFRAPPPFSNHRALLEICEYALVPTPSGRWRHIREDFRDPRPLFPLFGSTPPRLTFSVSRVSGAFTYRSTSQSRLFLPLYQRPWSTLRIRITIPDFLLAWERHTFISFIIMKESRPISLLPLTSNVYEEFTNTGTPFWLQKRTPNGSKSTQNSWDHDNSVGNHIVWLHFWTLNWCLIRCDTLN